MPQPSRDSRVAKSTASSMFAIAVVSVISRIRSDGLMPVERSSSSFDWIVQDPEIDFAEMFTSSLYSRPCAACAAIRCIACLIIQRSICWIRSKRSAVARNAVAGTMWPFSSCIRSSNSYCDVSPVWMSAIGWQ